MKRPNFFIIGAPKCGTTSLATWLSEHPNIYMSPIKEPHYFSSDLDKKRNRSPKEYEKLFENVEVKHKAIGESSVFYLYSKVAIPNILKEVKSPRFIVMLRNPVEMVYSFHEQLLFAGTEHIKDFKQAWRLQDERAKGKEISKWCIEPKFLQYGSVCKLGEQLERLYNLVPQKNILILLLDDVKKDARNEYLRVLDFLNVQDDGRALFPVYNEAKEKRSTLVRKMVRTAFMIQRQLNIPRLETGIMHKINKLNTKERPRQPLSEEMRDELKLYFRDDVEKLSLLINRDLMEWVK